MGSLVESMLNLQLCMKIFYFVMVYGFLKLIICAMRGCVNVLTSFGACVVS